MFPGVKGVVERRMSLWFKIGRDELSTSYCFYGFPSHREMCRQFQSGKGTVMATVFADFLMIASMQRVYFFAAS